jgi:hypothetical protein
MPVYSVILPSAFNIKYACFKSKSFQASKLKTLFHIIAVKNLEIVKIIPYFYLLLFLSNSVGAT